MPLGDTSSRWWPTFSLSRAARHTATTFIPLRPFIFAARRTLIFCAVILISYVLVTNMIGYERLWSYPSSTGIGSAVTTLSSNKEASATTAVDNHLLNRRQQKQQSKERDSRKIDVDGGGRAKKAEVTEGNETIKGNSRSKNDELESNDLLVDQPRIGSFRNEISMSKTNTDNLTGIQSSNVTGTEEEPGAKAGDVVDDDSFDGARTDGHGGNEKNGAQLIETILLNRTGATSSSAIEEQGRRRIGTDYQKRTAHASAKLSICPMPPPTLTGKMKQAVLLMSMLKESDVIRSHPELSRGGHWKPDDCKARYKIAVIVPFRDRQSHLNRLIDFLIPMLERQMLDFRFIVTEQYGKDLFNKGRIMNAAFILSEKLGVDCVIFHDVDMFPQDDRNFYYCPNEPKHLGAYVNTLGYELWYDYIVGGVLAITTQHYRQVNGYSNMYWAWGGEDDDMGYRILANNLTIERPVKEYGTYTMLKHLKRQRTAPSLIYKLLNTSKTRWPTDGLNKVEWKVVKLIVKPLYYHLYVDVGVPPDEWRYEKPTKK